mmetsp:Transcript_12883/g.29656  ORF Transcript_12883/g.29656 Transcript_12883/m.29656 type:complete len:215 (+) Transcript_12883:4104-4748(+)
MILAAVWPASICSICSRRTSPRWVSWKMTRDFCACTCAWFSCSLIALFRSVMASIALLRLSSWLCSSFSIDSLLLASFACRAAASAMRVAAADSILSCCSLAACFACSIISAEDSLRRDAGRGRPSDAGGGAGAIGTTSLAGGGGGGFVETPNIWSAVGTREAGRVASTVSVKFSGSVFALSAKPITGVARTAPPSPAMIKALWALPRFAFLFC